MLRSALWEQKARKAVGKSHQPLCGTHWWTQRRLLTGSPPPGDGALRAASALGSEVAGQRFFAASGEPAHARAPTPEPMPPGFPGDSRLADACRGQGDFLGLSHLIHRGMKLFPRSGVWGSSGE